MEEPGYFTCVFCHLLFVRTVNRSAYVHELLSLNSLEFEGYHPNRTTNCQHGYRV